MHHPSRAYEVTESKPMTIVAAPQPAATPPAKVNAVAAVAGNALVAAAVATDDAVAAAEGGVAAAATDGPWEVVAVTYSH